MKSHISEVVEKTDRLYGYWVQDPLNESLYHRVLEAQLYAGKLARIEEMLQRVPENLAQRIEFLHLRAQCEIAQNRLSEAETTLSTILAEQPLLIGPRVDQAHVLALQGRFADAAASLNGLEIADLPKEGIKLKLRIHHHLGDLEEVVATAKFWLTNVDSQDAQVAAQLGTALLDLGLSVEAKRWAERALTWEGGAVDAWTTLGMLALSDSQVELAQSKFQQALHYDIRSGRAWLGMGLSLLLQDRDSEAEEALLKAGELFPGYIGTWHILGWRALSQNKLSEAERHFLTALSLNKAFADTHAGLAALALARGNYAEAQGAIDLALRLDSQSVAVIYAQSLLLDANGGGEKGEIMRRDLMKRRLGGEKSLQAVILQVSKK
ncbi:tetratricopeptide repeat protein [Chitinibacteraceae bacterium HSL-7]